MRWRERILGDGWQTTHEALGVTIARRVKHMLTPVKDTRSPAEVHLRWRQPFDAAMPMLVVVPTGNTWQ